MSFKPTPIERSSLAVFEPLLGKPIRAVFYHYLPPSDGEHYAGKEKGLDSDLAAVVLDFDSHESVLISWAMVGDFHGLAIIPNAAYPGIATEVLNASSREAWKMLVGHEITGIGVSWQISGEECPESIWALRIDTAAGSIVIAQGSADGDIEYMPNELIVIFDQSLAHSYQPEHVDHSSWGLPL